MPSEFVQKHFDKLLLVAVFLFMLFFTLVAVITGIVTQNKVDPSNIAWCRETAGTILGALIGLISGMSMRGTVGSTGIQLGEKPDKPPQIIP